MAQPFSLKIWGMLAAGLMIFFILGISSYVQKNNTFDEEYHLLRGIYPWKVGHLALDQYHPPLVNVLAALPLAFNPKVNLPEGYDTIQDTYDASYQFLYKNTVDAEEILYPARFMMLMLGALLALAIFFWSYELFGLAAAVPAFWITVFSPNWMAHARLVTTDAGVTFFFFLAAYLFWRWLRSRNTKRLVIAGIALGLAQLSKFSAVTLYPAFFLAMFLSSVFEPKAQSENRLAAGVRSSFIPFLMLVLLSFAVITVGYGFHPGIYFKNFFHFKDQAVAALSTIYFKGDILFQYRWYFPVITFLLKMPIPVLILFLLGFLNLLVARRGGPVFVLVPVFYLAAAFAASKNTELRYILPVFPFVFMTCGGFLLGARQGLKKAASVLMILWLIAENLSVYPHYLTYFNQFAGGPQGGHRYLLSSHLDWGQDLKGLAKYMEDNDIPSVALAYFGKGDPDYYGINFTQLPSGAFFDSPYTSLVRYTDRPKAELPPKGWIAVSVSHIMGAYVPAPLINFFKLFQQLKPVAKIGNTIYVYNV